MKLIIDSNIVVSALLHPARSAADVLRAWRHGAFEWVSCRDQLAEIGVALDKPYLKARIGEVRAKDLLASMHSECTVFNLRAPYPALCRDPDDDWLVALLTQSDAHALVSGDRDLLVLQRQYPIWTVGDFLSRL